MESCVFYHFDKFDKLPIKKQKIHKLFKNNFFIQNELTNQKKMLKLENRTQFFYLCENSYELKVTKIKKNEMRIKGAYMKDDDTILLEYEDCKLIYLKNYLKNLNSPKKYVLTIINSYKHLLNSLSLLVSKNIFHNYINFDSILMDKFDYPLISNFSFSIDYSIKDIRQHIRHFIIAYDPSYLEWPSELHIISYLLTNKLDSLSCYNIEFVITELIKNNPILNSLEPSIVHSYKEDSIKYFKKYVNKSYENILNDMLQYAYTWDNCALSILFLRILTEIDKSLKIKNKFITLFIDLLVNNINLNPSKRLSIEMTMDKFNYLLDNIETKYYREIVDILM